MSLAHLNLAGKPGKLSRECDALERVVENHGVLVGWTHHDLGQKLVLKLQTLKRADTPHDVDLLTVILTKNQAAVLGNFLFEIAGQSQPARGERGWFRRVFG